MPIVNELHGKISFEDHAGVIPRDAPLMIWNDAVDLGALELSTGRASAAARSAIDSRNLDLRHARIGRATFPPGLRARFLTS